MMKRLDALKDIKSPYILTDVGKTGKITTEIVWQDSRNLISSVSYDATAYEGKGGLQFSIGDKKKDENGNDILVNSRPGVINDEIHSNLWLEDKKTIYDPCPPGYKVAPVSAFTAFTTTDWPTIDIALHGYNVSQDNMLDGYKEGNMEFYVDGKRKLITITFPLSGYRDYDAGEVYYVGNHLYVWEARNFKNDDDDTYQENNYSNFLKAYMESDGYIGVNIREAFYATDACSVRPIKE